MPKSCEQIAREMLDRMDVPDARYRTSGDLVELANLIHAMLHALDRLRDGSESKGLTADDCKSIFDTISSLTRLDREMDRL